MKSSTATDLDEELQRVALLEDRLAILGCIADDCVGLAAIGEPVPDAVWRHLRRIALCAEHGLSPWRQVPYYQIARSHIRAAIADVMDQLERPA